MYVNNIKGKLYTIPPFDFVFKTHALFYIDTWFSITMSLEGGLYVLISKKYCTVIYAHSRILFLPSHPEDIYR